MSTEAGEQSRFAHLIYTSDREGFGVKDSNGDWSAEELTVVRQHISPTVSYGVDIPATYSPERDEPLPRRMVWTSAGESAMGLWHSVPVEPDYSGRKASVFAQCMIDRSPDQATQQRPIDWWGSADLQRPYFLKDYSTARLAVTGQPAPGEELSRDSLYMFLTSQGALMRNLLDAVYAAMHGGPTVVLGTSSQTAAALAVGVVSHLMSPRTAHTFRFSLLETASVGGADDSLTAALERELHLIAVPKEHFDSLTPSDRWVLIDELEPRDGEDVVGEARTLKSGQSVTVTPWSVLSWAVFEWGTSSDFAALDERSAMVGDVDLDQAVPVATMAATDPEQDESIRALAGEVLMDFGPKDPTSLPDAALRSAIKEAISAKVGSSLQDAWTAVDGLRRDGSGTEWVLQTYLERLAADPPAVLNRGLRVPGTGFTFPRSLLGHLLTNWVEPRASDLGEDALVYAVRYADHLVRLGLQTDPRSPVAGTEAYRDLIKQWAPRIASVGFVEAAGPIEEHTAEVFVRPAMTEAWREGALEIPSPVDYEVYYWLWPQPPETTRVDDGLHFAGVFTRLMERLHGDDIEQIRTELLAAATSRRSHGPQLVAEQSLRPVLGRLVVMAPLTAAQLDILADPRTAQRLPERAATTLLLQQDYADGSPAGAPLLVQRQPQTPLGMGLQGLLQGRLDDLVRDQPDVEEIGRLARAGVQILREATPEFVGASLVGHLYALVAVANVELLHWHMQRQRWIEDVEALDAHLAPFIQHAAPEAAGALAMLLERTRRYTDFVHAIALLDAVASQHLDVSNGKPEVLRTMRVTDVEGVTPAFKALQQFAGSRSQDDLVEAAANFAYLSHLSDSDQRAAKIEKALAGHWRRCAGGGGFMGKLFGKGGRKNKELQEEY